jgi:Rieske Fe-S protein
LHVLGATALCACSAGSASPEPVGDVAAGNLSDLPVGSLRPIDSLPVCIGRDDAGVYAMTLTCTHAGCNMAQDGIVGPNGAACACHGSRFDRDGNVVRGPASDPLQHFAVTADPTGNITIVGDQYVAQDVRLKS